MPGIWGDGQHDDTAGIQALLDRGLSCVSLPPPQKHYSISRTLKIHSNQTLMFDRFTLIRLADHSDCLMLSNDNHRDGNENIAVVGGIWDMNNVNQTPNPLVTKAVPWLSPYDPDRYMGMLMRFVNVRYFQLRGLTLRDAVSLGVELAKIRYFAIDDITIDFRHCNPRFNCMDGIHFYGQCRFGTVNNVQGATSDDLIAINPDDAPSITICRGPVEDISISNIFAEDTACVLRLLSTSSPIRRITLSNVFATVTHHVFQLSNFRTYVNFYPDEDCAGVMEDIVAENVCASVSLKGLDKKKFFFERHAFIWIERGMKVDSLRINGLRRAENNSSAECIAIDRGATVTHLDIDGVYCANRTNRPLHIVTNDGIIDHLSLKRVYAWAEGGAERGCVLINTGLIRNATIKDIVVRNFDKEFIYHSGRFPIAVRDADRGKWHDFPVQYCGFQWQSPAVMIHAGTSEDAKALALTGQSDPFPVAYCYYEGADNEIGEETPPSTEPVPAPQLEQGYRWYYCGEHAMFYAGRRFALCFGKRMTPRQDFGPVFIHEAEFSLRILNGTTPIPPPGLYAVWVRLKSEKQNDGAHTVNIARVAIEQRPLPIKGTVSLPQTWQVFSPFETGNLPPAGSSLRTIPSHLDAGQRRIEPISVTADKGRFDFTQIWGGVFERRQAYVYIPFTVGQECPETFGFGADWWFQAWLDGEPLLDTLAAGNGMTVPAMTDHIVTTDVKQGAHLLVVRFISGNGSSRLSVGGAQDIRSLTPQAKEHN